MRIEKEGNRKGKRERERETLSFSCEQNPCTTVLDSINLKCKVLLDSKPVKWFHLFLMILFLVPGILFFTSIFSLSPFSFHSPISSLSSCLAQFSNTVFVRSNLELNWWKRKSWEKVNEKRGLVPEEENFVLEIEMNREK